MKILIAEDSELVRAGARASLEQHADIEIVAEVASGKECVAVYQKLQPDVVLLDIQLQDGKSAGFWAAANILEKYSQARIVILTVTNDSFYLHCFLRLGVKGFVLKADAASETVKALQHAVNDQYYVSQTLLDHYLRDMAQGNFDSLSIKHYKLLWAWFIDKASLTTICNDLEISKSTYNNYFKTLRQAYHVADNKALQQRLQGLGD